MINSDSELNDGCPQWETASNQISFLMYYLGLMFDADYSERSTNIDSDHAISVLKNKTMNVSSLEDYDIENVINELKKGSIIYI